MRFYEAKHKKKDNFQAKRDSVLKELTRTQKRAGLRLKREDTYSGYSASYGTYDSVPVMHYKSPEVTEHKEERIEKKDDFQQCKIDHFSKLTKFRVCRLWMRIWVTWRAGIPRSRRS